MRRNIRKLLIVGMFFILAGCKADEELGNTETKMEKDDNTAGYQQITQEEAKQLMDTEENYIILDVRTKEEYDRGHIPGAVCIPNQNILSEEPKELIHKEQLILVYCRSGNRSKQAAKKLADMGYTNVKEFGGINTWSYDIVIDET